MPKDIKLFALAKQLNVGIGSLKESLERRNVPNMEKITPNTRVSPGAWQASRQGTP